MKGIFKQCVRISIFFLPFRFLREIKFCCIEVPKTAILTILAAPNYEVLDIFDFFRYEILPKIRIQSLQN